MDGVYTVYANGWINGYDDGTFLPERSVTRAELARERICCYAEPVIEEVTDWLLADYGGADYAF